MASAGGDPHFAIDSQKQQPALRISSILTIPIGGIYIAWLLEATNVEATQVTNQMTLCSSPLPDLEVPMINTMVTCLGSEHRKLNYTIVQLAFAAPRLASDPDAVNANQRALGVWEEIRQIYGRICKSKTGWCTRGARRITQFPGHFSIILRTN